MSNCETIYIAAGLTGGIYFYLKIRAARISYAHLGISFYRDASCKEHEYMWSSERIEARETPRCANCGCRQFAALQDEDLCPRPRRKQCARRGDKSATRPSSLSLFLLSLLCRKLSRSRKLSFIALYCRSYMLLLCCHCVP